FSPSGLSRYWLAAALLAAFAFTVPQRWLALGARGTRHPGVSRGLAEDVALRFAPPVYGCGLAPDRIPPEPGGAARRGDCRHRDHRGRGRVGRRRDGRHGLEVLGGRGGPPEMRGSLGGRARSFNAVVETGMPGFIPQGR